MMQSMQRSLVLRCFRGAWRWRAALFTLLVAILPALAFAQTFRICHKPASSGGKILVVNAVDLQNHLGHGDYEVTAEQCDGRDNDCDGRVDEGFDLQSDPNHCGACGTPCTFPQAHAACVAGVCALGACTAGWVDLNGTASDGCEYPCTQTGPEACDNSDNDCDGVIDNGFDKQTDPRYCSNCAGCHLAQAVAGCHAGQCTIAGCVPGFVDLNGGVADGCEYPCTQTGPEVCDGLDNDCDGLIDGVDPSMVIPANFCQQAGECAGTSPTCTGPTGWRCLYSSAHVELDANGNVVAEETRCDNRDNDCDRAVDEPFPLKGAACAEDGTFSTVRQLGVCRGTGTLVCNAAMTELRCHVTSAGAPPSDEVCNNRDDDCDGHVDEPYDSEEFRGVRDVLVGPVIVNGQVIAMYRYEATRPDATSTTSGVVETRACSVAARLPWESASFFEAQVACRRAGMRLCQVTRNAMGQVIADEWGRFCAGAGNRTFPYGNTYSSTACNGADFDPLPGGVNEDIDVPTGNIQTCQSQDLAMDMSGNLKEWVDDPRTVGGQSVHTLRGGSYDNFEDGLTCAFDLTVVPLTSTNVNTGFRCCARSCTAGQSDCSGTCVDLATSTTNCGACGAACGAGTTCSNGYCCPTGTRACGDGCVSSSLPCP